MQIIPINLAFDRKVRRIESRTLGTAQIAVNPSAIEAYLSFSQGPRPMKLNSRMTTQELIEFQRRAAMLLWRRAPHRPTKAARLLTLRRAQCLAGLARALDADPNLRETAARLDRDPDLGRAKMECEKSPRGEFS
jgi:hypothetical protein